jgi:DNA-binding NtrC family response regulator
MTTYAGVDTNHYRILIVDDDNSILEELGELLEMEDYIVSVASSGNAALEVLAAGPIDLLLSDIRMPDGDGEYLLTAVRKQDPSIPFIFMTGHSDLIEREALEKGANAYLHKPLNVETLLTVMEEELASAYTQPRKTTSGPVIDLPTHDVRRGR